MQLTCPSSPAPAHTAVEPREVVSQIRNSTLYRDYAAAFETATGLPLALRASGSFQSPLVRSRNANAFCLLMAKDNKTCSACLLLQQQVEQGAGEGANTLQCFAGLRETSIPVKIGSTTVGYLQTGQVFHQKPTATQFTAASKSFAAGVGKVETKTLASAYFGSRVIPKLQYESVVRLLAVFAQQLSAVSNQLMVQQTCSESPTVGRAREYIQAHFSEEISLRTVASAAHVSPFYFCKIFKSSTGLTFTDYVARVRMEEVKRQMLNPHARISEIAYAVGFQSLSQFNRVFRRVVGESPTEYRRKLNGVCTSPTNRTASKAA